MVIGDDVYLVHTAWENVAIQERQKTECVEQMRPIQAQKLLGAIIPVVRLKSHFRPICGEENCNDCPSEQ